MIDSYFLGKPDDPGQNIHLFLDDFAIEDRWDAERVQNEAVKHPGNPIVVPDQPWEVHINAPSVLYDPEAKRFRMWYNLNHTAAWTRHSSGKERLVGDYGPYIMSYAESEDGINWHKQLFRHYPFGGFDETNIVFTGLGRVAGFVVTFTPEPMSQYGRFMCTYKDDRHPGEFAQQELNDYISPGHTCLAFSDDGIEWRPYEGNPLCPCLDTIQNLHWDERLGHWMLASGRPFARAATEDLYRKVGAAIRGGKTPAFAGGMGGNAHTAEAAGIAGIGRAGAVENVRTRIAVAMSPDLKTWYPPREVLMPDAADDAEQKFFDHMPVHRYGTQYVGFLSVCSREATGPGWLELIGSPDGLRWHRPRERTPFLAPGPDGAWDAGHVWSIKNVVAHGEWLYMYYSGSSRPWRYRYPDNSRAIGLARIRCGRFSGYYGDVDGAHLLSREVKVGGPQLLVNCSSQHRAFSREWHGSLHTELVERSGRAIEGFTYNDCDANHADDPAIPITWRGKDLSALLGRSVYLRFFMRNMFLFGFQFGESGGSASP